MTPAASFTGGSAVAVDPRLRLLRGTALICVMLMLATISLSAYMRLSQAGLGCAGWPACYGQGVDLAQTHVALARLAHRLVATIALILVLTMVLATWLSRPRLRREGWLSGALLALALALAVLGVFTPGARLPWVTLGNLLGGFVMLALSWRLAAVAGAKAVARSPGLGAPAVAGLALLAGQLVTGALVSASFSATACGALGDCVDQWCRLGWSGAAFDPGRLPGAGALVGVADAASTSLQLVHRLGALPVLLMVLAIGALAFRRGLGRAGMALVALALLQVALGLLMVGTGLPLAAVLLHNLVAALMLALLVRLV